MNIKKPSNYKHSAQVRRNDKYYVDLSVPMLFCAIEAIVLFALMAGFNYFFLKTGNQEHSPTLWLIMLVFYVLSAGLICLIYLIKFKRAKKARNVTNHLETDIYDVFKYIIDLPYAVVDREGKVKVMNGALLDILGYKNAVSGIDLSDFCSVSIASIASSAKNREAYLEDTIYDIPEDGALPQAITRLSDGRRYQVISYVFKNRDENYYFTTFKDIEDLLSIAEREERDACVVAYIALDNLQELTQYVRADYRQVSTEIENILRSWVIDMNGFIREYENDKYLAVFSRDALSKQILLDFDIQQRIMDLKIGDNSFPVTISIGIASINGSYAEKEKAAHDALNIAVKRGGNQVAVRREDSQGYTFFGGTHKTMENNTAIVSRVSGEILEKKIREAGRVLIMGHANPDFDSIGSCVGMARLAMEVIEDEHADKSPEDRPKVNIVITKKGDTFDTCYAQLKPLGVYDDIFITKEDAQDLVTEDTVLLICDVSNPFIFEAAELAKTVPQIAVLDHHRLASALTFEPFLQYVEATKSSASEIVAEILFRSKYASALHKEEAEVLLSGIMLDTNNFTRNAGAQTFEITHYLYSRGAHTGVVREFFRESLEELMMTGEFESKAEIFRDQVAIARMELDRPSTPQDRIIASKVADKLLNVKGVEASFAMIKIDHDVVISGRSKGVINVQLILERLKGGGHFDIAGAQIKKSTLSKAFVMLTEAINDYFVFDHRSDEDR